MDTIQELIEAGKFEEARKKLTQLERERSEISDEMADIIVSDVEESHQLGMDYGNADCFVPPSPRIFKDDGDNPTPFNQGFWVETYTRTSMNSLEDADGSPEAIARLKAITPRR